jgi:hypothetical protein
MKKFIEKHLKKLAGIGKKNEGNSLPGEKPLPPHKNHKLIVEDRRSKFPRASRQVTHNLRRRMGK